MSTYTDVYPFEKFPHEHLKFHTSRRHFFIALLDKISQDLAAYNADIPSFKLSELGELPDEDMAKIIPVRIPDAKISLENGWIYIQPPNYGSSVRFFSTASPALTAFNLMNGQNNLFQMAEAVAKEQGWSGQKAFLYVRGLFLALVQCCAVRPLLPKI